MSRGKEKIFFALRTRENIRPRVRRPSGCRPVPLSWKNPGNRRPSGRGEAHSFRVEPLSVRTRRKHKPRAGFFRAGNRTANLWRGKDALAGIGERMKKPERSAKTNAPVLFLGEFQAFMRRRKREKEFMGFREAGALKNRRAGALPPGLPHQDFFKPGSRL